MAKKSYIVTHGKLYLAANSKDAKLQHVPKGSEVKLEASIGDRLVEKGKAVLKSEASKVVKVGADDKPTKDSPETESK